jgi:hypothetical protein
LFKVADDGSEGLRPTRTDGFLAGYRAEHDDLMPDTWRRHYYSASAAYSTTESAARQDGNHANRANEVLWFSPHCVTPDRQGQLWEAP